MEVLTSKTVPAALQARAAKIISAFLCLVLCAGMVPHVSWAAETSETFAVALTVVDTTDASGGVLANVKVDGLSEKNTVADLLQAAGFTKADSAEATAGSNTLYAENWGYPVFCGGNLDTTWAVYWVSMYNGDSANYASAALSANLQNGGHYQYIYGSSQTFAYSDATPDPLASEDGSDKGDNDGGDEGADANIFDATKAATLVDKLSSRFSAGGSSCEISNGTMYAALAINAQTHAQDLDANAILNSFNTYQSRTGYAPGAGQYAKYIMALSAAGVDCTSVADGGATRNLVSEMEALLGDYSTLTEFDAVFILPVYAYDGYESGLSTSPVDALINIILQSATDEALFGKTYGGDRQTTAQGILALLPYRSTNAAVDTAITKAASALVSAENADGGFGYSNTYNTSDIDTTASVVAALAALGYDCEAGSELTTNNGSTPAGFLLAKADATLDGYKANSAYDEQMTAATALMGLVAAEGFAKAGAAFNVYELRDDARVAAIRLAGSTRYGTMAAVVDEGFAQSDVAVLVTGENYPDALAASALAGLYDAPVVLTEGATLGDEAKAQLARLQVKKVYILGGRAAINSEVFEELATLGYGVSRISGDSRQETSLAVYNQVVAANTSCDTVVIASGSGFADALSISPYAYESATPILLTQEDGTLSASEVSAIKTNASIKKVVIVGGTSAVSDGVCEQLGGNESYSFERLSGSTRYDTSVAIAAWETQHGLSAGFASVATGEGFPDALAGAAFTGSKAGVLLLAADGKSQQAVDFLGENAPSVQHLYVYGGEKVVPESVVDACVRALR